MQNAAKRRFWDHTMGGGGGGVVANREPGSYILGLEPTDPITFDPNFLGNPTSYNWGEISLDYK